MAVSNRVVAGVGAGLVAVLSAVATLQPSTDQLHRTSAREGRVLTAYLDPVKVWTICDGSTTGVYKGQKATPAECDARLKKDMTVAVRDVQRLVKVPVTQDQFDALVDFAFNAGGPALAGSTLLKRINEGTSASCWAAGKEFLKWDKGRVNGVLVPLPGLTKRRAEESALWNKGCQAWQI